MPTTYQLMVETDAGLVPTSWPPRSYRSAAALFRYYSRTWPANSYWLREINA